MVIPPKYAASCVIEKIKRYMGNGMWEKFVWLEDLYWKELVVRSQGYFVSTVGLDERQTTEYLKWQGAGYRLCPWVSTLS
jgi:REP element-mobilizing transposase RayT